MPNYTALKAKIDADHGSDTDDQIATALNLKNIPAKKPIVSVDIKRYLLINRVWPGVKKAGTNQSIIAMDALDIFDEFDITVPAYLAALTGILDDLVAEVQIPDFLAQHKTEILAMGDIMESWADQNWSGRVTVPQIQEARTK